MGWARVLGLGCHGPAVVVPAEARGWTRGGGMGAGVRTRLGV